jgi:hypothetical protein
MFLVQTIRDNVLSGIAHVGTDRAEAEQKFISTCASEISNWDEYDPADIAAVLDEGYAIFGGGAVMLVDTDGFTSDDNIRDALTRQPSGDVTIAEIVDEGYLELEIGMTVDQIIEKCASNLDSACSWDIQGQVLFKGSNGKWYTSLPWVCCGAT